MSNDRRAVPSALAFGEDPTVRREWVALILAAAGFGYSVALVGAAFFVDVYEDTCGISLDPRACSDGATTLVGRNGLPAIILTAVLALLSATLLFLVARASIYGGSATVAWVLIIPLAATAFLGAASVGLYIAPVPLLFGSSAALLRGNRAYERPPPTFHAKG